MSDAASRYLALRTQEGFLPYTIRAYQVQHNLLIRDIGDVEDGPHHIRTSTGT
ncbi:hypothetical protein JZ785_02535 [Alicyclobacillus curvatus]|nr:hypothetical protein JZ785_02535 [Alicyclobacillus curvatus]